MLVHVAALLRTNGVDIFVARVGGDEFRSCLNEADNAHSAALADRIIAEIRLPVLRGHAALAPASASPRDGAKSTCAR